MIVFVDIDDTICRSPKDSEGRNQYQNAVPYTNRIQQVNDLFDQGHQIHYWTSRGQTTGIDWTELTHQQLLDWGCKFTSINMNKPMYDWWIDDKSFHPEDFFQ